MLLHDGNHRFADDEGSRQIDPHDALEIFQAHLLDGNVPDNPGDIHRDVDPGKTFYNLFHGVLNFLFFCHVRFPMEDPITRGIQVSGDLLDPLTMYVDKRQLSPGAVEATGDGFSDPAGGSRHKTDLLVKHCLQASFLQNTSSGN